MAYLAGKMEAIANGIPDAGEEQASASESTGSRTKIKPVLHWNEHGNWLLWGFMDLVHIEKAERDGKPYYKLKYPLDWDILHKVGHPDIELICDEDGENCALFIADDEHVHDRLKEIFEKIIAELPYEDLQECPYAPKD